ncbi:unnamed protein product [marine sediment metagenome]|uniref:Uncharacterized protein n=1 Tax=marine sediment metagenome TaxID=412755 RepID=X1CJZ8_9ZZZZ
MNWYKKAQSYYIFGKKDDTFFMNNPKAWGIDKEAIRLNNGEILYGGVLCGGINHWSLFALAKPYIGDIKNIESLGWISSDGTYKTKIRGSEVREYLNPSAKDYELV